MGKRLVWVDMAKGIAIVSMVMGHCLDSDLLLRNFIYSFHMPLFFVLAGFTMHAKPHGLVISQSARRLLVPYFVVCGILLFFAFVPPSSISSALDTQKSVPEVIVEILYGSGQEGSALGFSYSAIGALWFLPCLFVGRVVLNEILLVSERVLNRVPKEGRFLFGSAGTDALVSEIVLVALVAAAGFFIGRVICLPFDIDTALVAVFFMYVGYRVKLFDLGRIPAWFWLLLLVVWLLYPLAGLNEMAIRAYLVNPLSIFTATAGSLVVMRLCKAVEKAPGLSQGLAWCGINSLYILCVHRVESAVFNWQKIMETLRPDVWDWNHLAQGLYQFGLRLSLVLFLTALLVGVLHAAHEARAARS